jgi:regulator of protease activity HflC (stomatin/prohibitin superfamily)
MTTQDPQAAAQNAPQVDEEKQRLISRATSIEHRMTALAMVIVALPAAGFFLFLIMGGLYGNVRALICLVIAGLLLAAFIKQVRAVPKQVGVRTFLGERLPLLKQEGWNLVIPYIWDLIRVDVTEKNTDLSQKKVTTTDGEVGVSASMTWRPDYKNPFAMIRYLDVGTVEGVEEITDDPTNQAIRAHAIGETTDQAQADKEGFRNEIIDQLGRSECEELRDSFKNGQGHLALKLVGIEVTQMTVPDVALPEEVQKRKINIVNEKYDKKQETIERNHSINSIVKIRDKIGLTPDKATQFWQTERKKVKLDVHEEVINIQGQGGGLGDLMAGARVLAQAFAGANKGRKDGDEGRGKKENIKRSQED